MKNIYGDAGLVTNVELYNLVILTVVILWNAISRNDIWRCKEHFIAQLKNIHTKEHWWTDCTHHSYIKRCVVMWVSGYTKKRMPGVIK